MTGPAETRALSGRTALVTGASRGIGAAVAMALASAGARIAAMARSRQVIDGIARQCGNGSFAIECDVTSPGALDRAIAEVRARFGGAPDIVVNNAGLFTIRAVEETTRDELDAFLDTNLTAPFVLIAAFLAEMRARGSGHVVTIGSVADRKIFAGNAAYSATKFGGRAVHEVLREETRGTGVRATLVSPAAVSTDIWEPIRFAGAEESPDRSAMLDPADVAQAVLFAVTQPSRVNVDELRLSRS